MNKVLYDNSETHLNFKVSSDLYSIWHQLNQSGNPHKELKVEIPQKWCALPETATVGPPFRFSETETFGRHLGSAKQKNPISSGTVSRWCTTSRLVLTFRLKQKKIKKIKRKLKKIKNYKIKPGFVKQWLSLFIQAPPNLRSDWVILHQLLCYDWAIVSLSS